MDVLIGEIIISILKHGWNWAAVTGVVIALYKNRKALLKLLHRGQEQETQLDQIQRDIRLIKAHMGVGDTWDVGSSSGKNERDLRKINGLQKRSLLQQVAYAPVITAGFITRLGETYHSLQRRMNMKSKLLSRKFLMAVISAGLIIANDGLNLGLDQGTIIAFGSIVVGWIIGEAAVDVAKKPTVSDIEKSYHSE